VTTDSPVVISMGEPAGIGPEVALKAWQSLEGRIGRRVLRLAGTRSVFAAAAEQCGIARGAIEDAVVETGIAASAEPGRPRAENARAVTGAIETALKLVIRGHASAMVTAPIHKAVLTEAGFGFPGHTEFLAALTDTPRAVMMLASHEIAPPLRVVPQSVHIALGKAVASLDTVAIIGTAEITLAGLRRDFGVANPRLAIAGLNPHAGEDGTMGSEDRAIITPAIAELRARGHAVSGPHPADTLFHGEARARYDAALCMYHDQALIPIKTLAFWSGVNVTLGLPIVRTSPDHGTALDIAGRGIADERSMIAAIRMAADIADRRGR